MTLYEYSMLVKTMCHEHLNSRNGKCTGCRLLDENPSMSMCMAMSVFGDFNEEATRKLYADKVEQTLNTYAQELRERRRAKNLLEKGLQTAFPDLSESSLRAVVKTLTAIYCPFVFFSAAKTPSGCADENDENYVDRGLTSSCQNDCWLQYIPDGNEPQRSVVGK